MPKSAEGIVEKAATFTSIVRKFVKISLVDKYDKPIANSKFKVTFQNGKCLLVESDNEGVIKFPKIAKGELDIELLEDEEKVK